MGTTSTTLHATHQWVLSFAAVCVSSVSVIGFFVASGVTSEKNMERAGDLPVQHVETLPGAEGKVAASQAARQQATPEVPSPHSEIRFSTSATQAPTSSPISSPTQAPVVPPDPAWPPLQKSGSPTTAGLPTGSDPAYEEPGGNFSPASSHQAPVSGGHERVQETDPEPGSQPKPDENTGDSAEVPGAPAREDSATAQPTATATPTVAAQPTSADATTTQPSTTESATAQPATEPTTAQPSTTQPTPVKPAIDPAKAKAGLVCEFAGNSGNLTVEFNLGEKGDFSDYRVAVTGHEDVRLFEINDSGIGVIDLTGRNKIPREDGMTCSVVRVDEAKNILEYIVTIPATQKNHGVNDPLPAQTATPELTPTPTAEASINPTPEATPELTPEPTFTPEPTLLPMASSSAAATWLPSSSGLQ